MSAHDRIEEGFEGWARGVCRRRWATLWLALLATGALAAWLPRLHGEFDTESFLSQRDPALLAYHAFRAQFGREDRVLIALDPPEVFERGFLTKLVAFHRELEREVPYLKGVTSLVNARRTRGDGDRLVVEDLMPEPPRSAQELRALRERALANPLYRVGLISPDASLTTVTLEPLTYSQLESGEDALAGFEEPGAGAAGAEPPLMTEAEHDEIVAAIERVAARYRGPDFPLHVLGGTVMATWMRDRATRDASVFLSLSVGMTALVLFGLFRRVSAVLLPLAVILLSLVATLGAMAGLGIPFSVVSQIVPTFLIAIGICDAVHILALFYRRLARGDGREDAIAYALRHSGLAVVMTSLTTAGGLASFAAAEVEPVADLGIVSPLGVMLALVYTLTLLPALLAIVPMRAAPREGGAALPLPLDRMLVGAGALATRHPRAVLALTGALLLVGLGGVARVRFAHEFLELLPESDPVRAATELVDRELSGTATVELMIDTGAENGLHEPARLNAMEGAAAAIEALGGDPLRVDRAVSLVDLVKEIHRALNEDRPSHYVLPQDRRLVAQELLLFESSGSDDLDDFCDSRFRLGRITLRVPNVDGMLYPRFLERVERTLREELGPGVDFHLTGTTTLYARTFEAVISTVARSYVLALLVITPMMILLVGHLRRGLLAMIPNLIPVFLTLGLMGWLGITLNFSTLLVGSIVIGVAVDDTIHFMHRFNRYYEASGDVAAAVRETLVTTGSAMFVTSVVLALSFGLFVFGYIRGTVYFGLLTAFATVVAFLADVLLAPALLALALGARRRPR